MLVIEVGYHTLGVFEGVSLGLHDGNEEGDNDGASDGIQLDMNEG